ncbi:hypothetical protein LPTSP3_g18440 [Leptospira kobayashii]|uniref:Uncharacterized protein n=1 Tax=Leptospira kobayashii TaxID=1917830 RepID=A0ABN6KGA2_9LEPT|nr:hypothetical protein LPTSP3_g18440 [Leptospira kobayashii]
MAGLVPGFYLGAIKNFPGEADYVQFPESISEIGNEYGMSQGIQVIRSEILSPFA